MNEQRPKIGDVYKHFKGNLYEVITIAKHTETMEEMVVYKELDGTNVYVRPLDMFLSKVDRTKYPDILQEYRFELQNEEDKPSILEFLECESTSDKLRYLEMRKESLTDDFLSAAAQCLDFVENEGNFEKRYQGLLQYLKMVEKYEIRRI